jgi:hypothetical protein
MTTALLQTTYFGPVQWYQKLKRYDHCVIEQYDSYQKQTYRNRCVIATANGLQALTVPVDHSPLTIDHVQCKDLRISDHNQWRRVHWNALQSAYSESPFFEYYADDIRPFFEQKYEFLIDFNEAIRQKMCELLDIETSVSYSSGFMVHGSGFMVQDPGFRVQDSGFMVQGSWFMDFREVIHAKHPQDDPEFQPRSYWQVFQHRYGFQPNLSILDLLFCMGPEAVFYL